jgi:hypothetical protein
MEGFLFGRPQEVAMPKGKRKSVADAVMERLREVLETLGQLGSLLRPGKLSPIPVPVRDRKR